MRLLWAIGCCAAGFVAAAGDGDYVVERDVAYGHFTTHRLDVYRPADPSVDSGPIIIWVHGGGWRIGDKSHAIDDKARLFTASGMMLVSVAYRLSALDDLGEKIDGPPFPDNAMDVARAVAWVHAHAGDIGGDPGRIVLMGHSAGAHLVALVAVDDHYLNALGLSGEMLAGVVCLDTEGYDVAERMKRPAGRKIYESAFGTGPDTWRTASPSTHVVSDAPHPPFLIVTRGAPVRLRQASQFADALRNAGGRIDLVELSEYSHADVNRKLGSDGEERVTKPVMAFLASVTN